MQFKVYFARFPGNHREHPCSSDWFYETYLKALADPRIGRGNCLRGRWSDTPIYMTRNLCVMGAKRQGADYLLMLDEDMEPDYQLGQEPGAKPFWETSWEFLMGQRDTPAAVAAPYMGGGEHENCFQFQWCRLGKHSIRSSLEQFTREQVAMFGGIEEVGALPTGCILYDLRVFHEALVPWFDYEHDHYKSVKRSTEDVFQTRNMSLAHTMTSGRVGGKCYCNWDSWAGHWKERRVEKPELVPIEAVGKELRNAVLAKHEFGEKLIFLPPRKPEATDEQVKAAIRQQHEIKESSNGSNPLPGGVRESLADAALPHPGGR